MRLPVLGALLVACMLNPVAADAAPRADSITRGEKFGVRIGDPKAEARSILLKRGLIFFKPRTCDAYMKLDVACSEDDDIDLFLMRKFWRHGNVFLIYDHSGRVKQIAWELKTLPHLDS